MSTAGTYSFTLKVMLSGDINPYNDSLPGINRTVAATVALPESVDFTGFVDPNLSTVFPNWHEATGAVAPTGNASAWINSTLIPGSGTTAKVNLFTNTRHEWIVGPRFVAQANTAVMFNTAITDYNSANADPSGMQGTDDSVIVKISTDCGGTWNDLFVFDANSTSSMTNVLEPQVISLSAYAGQQCIIAFYASDGPTDDLPDYDFHIDDILIGVPPTCIKPSGLIKSNITSSGVQIDWTSPASGSTPVGYQVYVTTSTTLPSDTTTATMTGIAGTTATVTGLNPATKYYYYVRTDCGAGDHSLWTGRDSFVTTCTAVTDFFENFDAVTTPAFPTCWARVGTGGATNTQTGSPFSAPNTLYLYGGSATSQGVVAMPAVSNIDLGDHQLKFMMRANITAGGMVEVGYLTDPTDATTFVSLQTVTAGSLTYQSYTVIPGPQSIGGPVVLAFRHTGVPATSVLIDNVSWEAIPACVEPSGIVVSNVTVTGAQVDWTAPSFGSPSGYEVYYSTNNTPPTGTTTPTVTNITGTTTNLTGLTGATKYYVYVRTVCGTAGSSAWSVADSFVTSCTATNVPYTIDFEGSTSMPICTATENAGTGNNWTVAANPGSGFTSNTLRYGYNFTNPADAWFFTRGVNLTAGVSYRVSFRYGNNSATTYTESMEVKYGTDATSASMTDLVVDYPSITGAAPANSATDFTPATSGVYYFGFHAYSIANQFNLYVDDISITETPACDLPSSVVASNINSNDAQVDWGAPLTGSPSSYDVYYSTSNVAPVDTTTATIAAVAGTTVNLTNLIASTNYYVWVRSNCTGGTHSTWTLTYMFTTACGVITAPTAAPQTFTGTFPPNCWTRARGILTSPTTLTGTTSNWGTANFGNVTTPANPSARLEIWTTNRQDWLITPSYDLGTGGNFQLEFDLALTNWATTAAATLDPDDKFVVLISTDNGVTWDPANALQTWDASTPISNTGDHIIIPLSTYTGTVMFAFYGESTVGGVDNNVYVDNVEVKSMGTVPVTLTSFTGERQGTVNVLTWNTATEQTNKGFEIQGSADGITFTTLAFVNSKAVNGNSTSALDYRFVDERPFSGNSYYRLKQVNIDGRSRLSNIVLIKGTKVPEIVVSRIYPNPTKGDLNVEIEAPANNELTLLITDMAGKVVNKRAVRVVTGTNKFTVNVEGYNAGTYFIKSVCANGCESAVRKFVKY